MNYKQYFEKTKSIKILLICKMQGGDQLFELQLFELQLFELQVYELQLFEIT